MIEFSENDEMCIDSKVKSNLDLIENGSVTLDISKLKIFVFLTTFIVTPLYHLMHLLQN